SGTAAVLRKNALTMTQKTNREPTMRPPLSPQHLSPQCQQGPMLSLPALRAEVLRARAFEDPARCMSCETDNISTFLAGRPGQFAGFAHYAEDSTSGRI